MTAVEKNMKHDKEDVAYVKGFIQGFLAGGGVKFVTRHNIKKGYD